MPESPDTRPSLLVRIRDGADRDAWREFVELYGPLIYRYGRKRGLQDADAADLTQTVLHAVAGSVQQFVYDPARGLFRGWLFAIVRNQIHKLQRGQRGPRGSGDTAAQELLQQQPARPEDEDALWQEEYRKRCFTWAAERCRGDFEESSWQAFWQTAVDGRPAAEVARAFGLTVGAVYTARSRVLARIRTEIEQLQDGTASFYGGDV
jgi:RNA polymerase sigma-70 factor (ECF subfamily)